MQHLTVFIFGLVCLSAVSAKPMTDEQKAHMVEVKGKCIAKSGVDVALLERAKAGEAIADNEGMNCFGACILQEMGLMDDAGAVQLEEAMKKIPEGVPHDKAEELITLCTKDLPEGDACKRAGAIFTCFHENKAMEMFEPCKE